MRRSRSLWLASLLLTLAVAAPQSAGAQISIPGIPQLVFDPKAVAEALEAARQRADQLVVMKRQLEYQVTMLRSLQNPTWRHLGLLHRDLAAVVSEGEALGYSLARLDSEFDRTFPGYAAPHDPRAADIERTRRTLATMRAVLRSAGMQARDAVTGQQTLDRIKGQMASVEGTQQALQLQATIQGHTADELSAIRQALAAQVNADAVYRADELQQRMQAAAAWDSTVARTRARPVAPLEYEDVRLGRRR